MKVIGISITLWKLDFPHKVKQCCGSAGRSRRFLNMFLLSLLLASFANCYHQPEAEKESGWVSAVKAGINSVAKKVQVASCVVLGLECCLPPFARAETAVSTLRNNLNREFFGQHLALETALTALDAHLSDNQPGKALVLSFHGWAGSGKTYLSQHIARALYEKGMDSKYVKFYMASYHFSDEKNVNEYKERIQDEIRRALIACPYALFVFDEVDKTPPGVFDAIVPFIEYPGTLAGVSNRKAIFVFLSNTGSSDITNISYQAWKDGRRREDLTFRDFEDVLKKEAFNNEGSGLFRSSLIDRVLVDYFIPFLPMERRHVLQCVRLEENRLGGKVDAENVVDSLAYWPADTKLYSQTGCKRVEAAVKYELALAKYKANSNQRLGGDGRTSSDKNEL